MNGRFEGKVALITGAGSGIGRASAQAFAREGARVVVADIDVNGGEETVSLIKQEAGEAVFIRTDVTSAREVEAMVARAVDNYGRLDCAHNNAGVEDAMLPTAECTEENWDRVININLKGVWLCMKYEIRQMLKQGKGSIVNTGSASGLVGLPGNPAYCASKGGVLQLTRAAALEYAQSGIRVNAVCPGPVHTALTQRVGKRARVMGVAAPVPASSHPLNRYAQPEEIVGAVLWLCSDDSSFVTGHPMVVDGGRTVQ